MSAKKTRTSLRVEDGRDVDPRKGRRFFGVLKPRPMKRKISRLFDWWLNDRLGRHQASLLPFESVTSAPSASAREPRRVGELAGLSMHEPVGACCVRWVDAERMAVVDETERVVFLGSKHEVEDWLDWRQNMLRS